ncbi:MAG: FeoA family protein [Promethearchaeota archaeon]
MVPEYLTLANVNTSSYVRVYKVLSGFKAKMRLANLGIVPGVLVKKLQTAPLSGPVAVEVKNKGQLVIGHGLAAKILVIIPENSFKS